MDSVLTKLLRAIPSVEGWREKLGLEIGDGAGDVIVGPVSAFVRTLLDDADAAAVLATLGIEAGTWTPTMAFATPGTSSFAYTAQHGNYLKVLNWYFVQISLTVTPTIGTGSGEIRISLPAAVGTRTGSGVVADLDADFTWPAGRTALGARFQGSTSYLTVVGLGSAGNFTAFAASNMTDGALHVIRLSGPYVA